MNLIFQTYLFWMHLENLILRKSPTRIHYCLKTMAWKRWHFCTTFTEKVKKRAFKGRQFKWMPYIIPNFHAFYWSLAILEVMFVNKNQHSHKNIRERKNLESPNLTYLMRKTTKQENDWKTKKMNFHSSLRKFIIRFLLRISCKIKLLKLLFLVYDDC